MQKPAGAKSHHKHFYVSVSGDKARHTLLNLQPRNLYDVTMGHFEQWPNNSGWVLDTHVHIR